MNKKLIEIFPNIEVKNNFTFSLVSKLEFSKKINSVIITATSDNFVSLLDIEQVKNDVITKYKLNNLKVIYNYSGDNIILNNDHILTILDVITKKAMYTKPIFENCNIMINDSVVITLEKPYSSFLEIKKINKYIADNLFIMYNINIDVKSNVIIEKPKSVKMDIAATKSEVKKDSKEYSKDNKNFNKYNKYDGGGNAKLKKNMPDYVVIGNDITSELTDRIDNINLDYDRFCIEGRICNLEFRKLKTGSNLLILDVTDLTSSVTCKSFLKEDNIDCITSKLKVNEYIKVLGVPKYDPYSKEVTVMINSIVLVDKPSEIMDNEEEKRVELHMHSQMSSMDGVSSAKDLVKKAVKWGHRAVAITDHGVVQAFPEMHQTISKIDGNLEDKTKVIYGLEGYFINDCTPNNVLD
ncbi:MAG: PHP domain-containing protein, partial [Clostridia bacterium]